MYVPNLPTLVFFTLRYVRYGMLRTDMYG